MKPTNEKVVAIICRNIAGIWESVQSFQAKKGDDVLFLPAARGLVAVLGGVRDEDYPEILRILEEIEAGQ